jgi:sigma-B regulation protein RsbU (phosphoserine phosphatase)
MTIWFLAGALVGALLVWAPLRRARKVADEAAHAARTLNRDRERLLEFMHLMTEALGEGLSTPELQQRIVHAAIVCTDALSGCFFEQTPRRTMRSAAVEGLFPPHRPIAPDAKAGMTTRAKFIEQVLKAEEFPVTEGVVGRVAQTRRGEWIADATADDYIVKHEDPALAVRSVIVVPLVFRDKFFGVLAVANPAGGRMFTESDFRLIESLAEQAALALHNSAFLHLQMEKRQLDLDLAIASGIQQMLLPREDVRLPGVEIGARYLPAKQVGGDLYDVFQLSPTQLGVVVADVSGKGIAASLLMAICRTNLRQIAPRHHSPADALRELNRTLESEIHSGHFITAVYAIIDVAANRLTFARAGHELPLIVRRDPTTGLAAAQFIASEGMGLGLVPDALFAEAIANHSEPFRADDLLVLYTDGLTEAPNDDGKEFAGARLADAVRAVYGRMPREVNDAIFESVRRFTGDTPQRDDFTLVTVQRL